MAASVASQLVLAQHHQDGALFSIIRMANGKVIAEKDGERVALKGLPEQLFEEHIESAHQLLASGRKIVWDQSTSTLAFQLTLLGGGNCFSPFPNPGLALSRRRTDEAAPYMIALQAAIGKDDQKGVKEALDGIFDVTFDKVPNNIFTIIRTLVEAVTLADNYSFSNRYTLAIVLHQVVDLAFVYYNGIEQETLKTMGDLLDVPLSKLDDNVENLQIRFSLECAKEGLKSFHQRDPQLMKFLQKAYKVSPSDDTNGNALPIEQQLAPNFRNGQLVRRSWYFRVLVAKALCGKISDIHLFDQYTLFLRATDDWHTLHALMKNLGTASNVSSFSSPRQQEVAAKAFEFLVLYFTGQKSKDVIETNDWKVRCAVANGLSFGFYESPYQKVILSLFADQILIEKDPRVKKHLANLQQGHLKRRDDYLKKKREEMGKALQQLEEGHFLDFFSGRFISIKNTIVSLFDKFEPGKDTEANIASIKKIVQDISNRI